MITKKPASRVSRPFVVGQGLNRHTITPTPVYETYWAFLIERQRTYFRRLRGDLVLTSDPIIARHRFTNPYRAADRVSQYLIGHIIAGSKGSAKDVFFRTLLFKIFNRLDTWEAIEAAVGPLHVDNVRFDEIEGVLDRRFAAGEPNYSAAYVMASPEIGNGARKHSAHLRLLKGLIETGLWRSWERSNSLRQVYDMLLGVQSFGTFLAFQYAVDLGYAPIAPHSETTFVVAGPGAKDGISKCFGPTDASYEAIIMAVTERQEIEFAARGLTFPKLWNRRLHPADIQNGFCEISKYARAAHPNVAGVGGRTRIKQTYKRAARAFDPVTFPAHWGLDTSLAPAIPSALDECATPYPTDAALEGCP